MGPNFYEDSEKASLHPSSEEFDDISQYISVRGVTELPCSKCSSPCSEGSSVIRLTNSAPDTGLRVTPMIPSRNSLAVGGVATCTVVSPQ